MTFNNAAVSDWAQKVQSQHLQRTELSWEGTGNLLGKWGRVNSLMEPEMGTQLLDLCALYPTLLNKRGHCSEEPVQEWPLLAAT